MRTTRAVRLDVGSLQHRQCTLARDRTSTLISVGHNHSECALAESRSNDHRFAVANTLDRCDSRWAGVKVRSSPCRQSFGDRSPQGLAGAPVFAVVSFTLDNIKAEIRRNRNPFSFSKEEWFGQEYATDLWVLHRCDRYASVLRDPLTHFRKRSNSVAFTE